MLQKLAGTYEDYIPYKTLTTRVFEETKTSTQALVFSSRLVNQVIRLCLETI
ncbi:hypothetical protein J2T22_001654 [Pseudarthrobacter defluvii]|uniref:Uncharacterized protein n=1 Tax=Pseudarthrobacter defluvii TaxID=410837 RepID=A0ABT9UFQ8_9MICC|nr:hypothetical protein [Pseudarthrobacter defluvii]MDQ0118476.1 hypothetical protein [Pseudarthrobacter defluvii]